METISIRGQNSFIFFTQSGISSQWLESSLSPSRGYRARVASRSN